MDGGFLETGAYADDFTFFLCDGDGKIDSFELLICSGYLEIKACK